MSKIYFSVIIPLYQKQGTIERAVKSVLAQTYPDFELIVVDDGSTDNGAKIVQAQNDTRIKLIRQSNLGVSAARNMGITNASQDFIALLDADDEWTPSFLEKIAELIEKYPNCGWYSTGFLKEIKNKLNKGSKYLEEGEYKDFFDLSKEYDVVNSSNVVLPLNILKELGYFPLGIKAGEDILMWVKIASRYPFAYTPELCSIYHYSEKSIYQRISMNEKDIYYSLLEEGNFSKNEFLAMQAIHRGILHSIFGNKTLAKEIEQRYGFTKSHVVEYQRLAKLNKYPTPLLKMYFSIIIKLRAIYRTLNPKR